VAQHLLFVDPRLGNDANAGNQQSPLRTITHALVSARAGTVIVLAPGTYSTDSGEVFPLALKPGVRVQGEPSTQGRNIVILGGGFYMSRTFAQQNIAILGANEAELTGVTVTNPNLRGYGLWAESSSPVVANNTFTGNTHDGISTTGTSSPVIWGNAFVQNGANGITIYGSGSPEVRENLFQQTGYGINIAQDASPLIVSNRIRQNRSGVVVQGNARPTLRDNTIADNTEDGLVAIGQSQPNLGTPDDPGQNTFSNNQRLNINATAAEQTLPAYGNQLSSDRVAGSADLTGNVAIVPSPQTGTTDRPPNPLLQQTTEEINQRSPSAPPAQQPSSMTPPHEVASLRPTPPESLAAPQRSPLRLDTLLPQTRPTPTAPTPTPIAPPERPSQRLDSLFSPTRPEAQQEGGVTIPVPPPEIDSDRVATRSPSPDLPGSSPSRTVRSGADREMAVNIPVPPPDSRPDQVVTRSSSPTPDLPAPPTSGADSPPADPVMARSSLPAPPSSDGTGSLQAEILPVPSVEAPLGNIGDMPTVPVYRNPTQQRSPGASPRRTTAANLRYRVVVEAESDRDRDRVRSLVPGAFVSSMDGVPVMQVGAFGDRDNAEAVVEMLEENGLNAEIESIDN
jgi:parallel beta-helix repeat protein